MERSGGPLWADMAGGLAMLDFITQANEFCYSQVQYAIKFVETCNSPSNRQEVLILTYLHTAKTLPTSLHWQQQQKLIELGRITPRRRLLTVDLRIDPSADFFFKSDELKNFRLIFGLAEFTRKIESSAKLRLNVNNQE